MGKLSGIRVSLFVEPDPEVLDVSASLLAPVVELHTGAYGHASGAKKVDELHRLQRAAKAASAHGIECHAGHGLTFDNVSAVAAIPELAELNIGHFLVGEAIFIGLGPAIQSHRSAACPGWPPRGRP